MSNIDYDKLRKLADQHPEIAGKVAEILKAGSGAKLANALKDLTFYLKQYVVDLSEIKGSLDFESDLEDLGSFTAEEIVEAARDLKRATDDLVRQDPDTVIKVSEGVRKHFYKKLHRIASSAGSAPRPNKTDHGRDQPLSGGWDIMKRLQDQLLIEQGRPTREPNPRLATGCGGSCGGSCSCGKGGKIVPAAELQQHLARVLQGGTAREMVRKAVVKYAEENDTVVMVNAAVDEIMDRALGVALSPDHLAAALDKHTIEED